MITRASSGSVSLDGLDEALDDVERLLVALLLGQPRVAREVGEGDRDPQAAELARPSTLGLEVADDVLLDEVPQAAAGARGP